MSRGREVKELREKMGMNRREFSDYYGIPYRTVQDWEAEKRELPEYLLRLLKYRAEAECRIRSEDEQVAASNDVVYIGPDLPDEYAHSNYTHILRGTNAKAKANAVQGLPELMEVANGKSYTENYKTKHNTDAMYGWYRYESRFALPVFDANGEITRYNIFNVIMVIRHAKEGKKYLYDIINIKKETSTLFQSEDITQ